MKKAEFYKSKNGSSVYCLYGGKTFGLCVSEYDNSISVEVYSEDVINDDDEPCSMDTFMIEFGELQESVKRLDILFANIAEQRVCEQCGREVDQLSFEGFCDECEFSSSDYDPAFKSVGESYKQ